MKLILKFLDYVELRTKITSIFAFLMVLSYLFYREQPINIKLTLIFFASMLLFDLTTTAINNYIDSKTNQQELEFNRATALRIIIVMLCISTALGLYLAYCTDIIVLILGGICFICGILYTYGPVPISRLPLGEVFSGIFFGILLPFILLYINLPEGWYFTYEINMEQVAVTFNLKPIFHFMLLSVAPVCTTANIMLANNICDLEKDIEVNRYTLPFYLGKTSIKLFAFLYYLVYIVTVVMVVLRVVPFYYLIMLLTIVPVYKNIKRFEQKQEKAETFRYSIKNYIIIMGSNVLALFLCGMIS